MTSYRKKLIEVALPLEGHQRSLGGEKLNPAWASKHFASVVGAAAAGGVSGRAIRVAGGRSRQRSGVSAAGRGSEGQERAADLFNLIEELVQWENSNNPSRWRRGNTPPPRHRPALLELVGTINWPTRPSPPRPAWPPVHIAVRRMKAVTLSAGASRPNTAGLLVEKVLRHAAAKYGSSVEPTCRTIGTLPQTPDGLWETTQPLICTLEMKGESEAAKLNKLGGVAETALRPGLPGRYSICEQKKWADEALAYNGLATAWPELTKLALAERTRQPSTQQGLFS